MMTMTFEDVIKTQKELADYQDKIKKDKELMEAFDKQAQVKIDGNLGV
jgi:pentose-5-phosphate-3-epimerase